MGKYYKLKLNCARTKGNPCLDEVYNCGYISYLPVVKTEETLFGKDLKTVEYSGLGYVIAEQKEDYFEDIVFEKQIKYNPNGIKNVEDLKYVPTEKLLNELNTDITCFDYKEISVTEVAAFIKQIENDKFMINRYKNELYYVLDKYSIKEELFNRSLDYTDMNDSLEIINEFKRKRNR